MSMSRRLGGTPPSHSRASHAPLYNRHSSSPLLSHSQSSFSPSLSPTHHSSNGNSTTSQQSETAASLPPFMDDEDVAPASTPPVSRLTLPSFHTPSFPVREDCWSEEATYTLIEAWGDRYVELNRGNLRQKHWQEVADAVNARHGHKKKARRTDIQCKNRIDTLKKKYKIEKSKLLDSKGQYTSPWPFFAHLDSLIGSSFKPSQLAVAPLVPPLPSLPPPSSVPVGPRSKRPAPPFVDSSFFRRNFSAMAAAAAAVETEEESDMSRSSARIQGRKQHQGGDEAYRQLAKAIGRFGEIYERVEEAKQKQMMELEKQRIQLTKDLELQRMKLFLESQVQLEKMKFSRRTSKSVVYRCNDEEHSASLS